MTPVVLRRQALRRVLGCCAVVALLSGCAASGTFLSAAGPSGSAVAAVAAQPEPVVPGSAAIQVIDLDGSVARRITASRQPHKFSRSLTQTRPNEHVLGLGDTIEVAVWEAPPAALFGVSASVSDLRSTGTSARAVVVPEKVVEGDGTLNVPFAGLVQVVGKTPAAVEAEIAQRLRGKANQPQVSVRVLRNHSATVTVVGEVANSIVMPLSARRERLLDALAAAGGTRQPVERMTIQITRGARVLAMPLGQVIREGQENVTLQPGDVVTLFNQPLSVMVLGAIARNEELAFESQGISLTQALARAGGLQDARADARGVFVFRMEDPAALPNAPLATAADGRVPVIYRVDMANPASMFAAQAFTLRDKDVLYVANAPAAELQKFLNMAVSLAYPLINVTNAVR